jgi:hypothetical protein
LERGGTDAALDWLRLRSLANPKRRRAALAAAPQKSFQGPQKLPLLKRRRLTVLIASLKFGNLKFWLTF